MAKMVVVTLSELAPGFRLAGVRTRVAGDPVEAAECVEELLADADTGVIALHEPFIRGMSAELRQRLEAMVSPLVVPLPAGDRVETPGQRRARLTEMLQKAVGYRIAFRSDEPES